MSAHETESSPCPLEVDDETLADLHDRIRRTRWTDGIAGAGWSHGTSIAYLRELATYWVDGFDWRAQERLLNERLPGRAAEVDGRRVHYARCEGVGPDPCRSCSCTAGPARTPRCTRSLRCSRIPAPTAAIPLMHST